MLNRIKLDLTPLQSALTSFSSATGGGVAILFALMSTPLFLSIGIALDYGYANKTRAVLQTASDSAALAGAKGTDLLASERIQIAGNTFLANFPADGRYVRPTPSIIVDAEGKVTVSAGTNVTTIFLKIINVPDIPISVKTAAIALDEQPICILALNPTMAKAIDIGGTGTLKAQDCAVRSNSTSDSALYAGGNSTAESSGFCAPGGYDGFNFAPTPTTCQPYTDPYKDMVMPTVGACQYYNTNIKKQDGPVTLTPGVYCGGINVATQAEVTMDAGIYIIKNGEFSVGSHAEVTGAELSLYLTGTNTGVGINGGAILSLSAPTSGAYKGFLFMQDPLSNPGNLNIINGGGTVSLTGTFYFPTQGVRINGNGNFTIGSSAMPIIADHVIVNGNGISLVDIDEDQMAADFPTGNKGVMLLN